MCVFFRLSSAVSKRFSFAVNWFHSRCQGLNGECRANGFPWSTFESDWHSQVEVVWSNFQRQRDRRRLPSTFHIKIVCVFFFSLSRSVFALSLPPLTHNYPKHTTQKKGKKTNWVKLSRPNNFIALFTFRWRERGKERIKSKNPTHHNTSLRLEQGDFDAFFAFC